MKELLAKVIGDDGRQPLEIKQKLEMAVLEPRGGNNRRAMAVGHDWSTTEEDCGWSTLETTRRVDGRQSMVAQRHISTVAWGRQWSTRQLTGVNQYVVRVFLVILLDFSVHVCLCLFGLIYGLFVNGLCVGLCYWYVGFFLQLLICMSFVTVWWQSLEFRAEDKNKI